MIKYICDRRECEAEMSHGPAIELKGYYPQTAGGILIPDNCRQFQFCSHNCFVKWMHWAMMHEGFEVMEVGR